MEEPRRERNTPRRTGSPRPTGNAAQSPGTGTGEKKKRRRRRSGLRAVIKATFYVVIVIGISVLLAAVGWKCAVDVLALGKAPHTAVIALSDDLFTEKEVSVKQEDGTEKTERVREVDVKQVAELLKENGLIEYPPVFRLFCQFTHAQGKLSPGRYELNTEMDYRAILSSMSTTSAAKVEISVTIPEGYSVQQIFELLEEKQVCTVEALNETAAHHDYKFEFLEGIPLGKPERLEGYLFPDTYRFYIGEDPLYAINKMLVNFSVMVSRDTRDELKKAEKSLHDIITIASLIEKETDGTDMAVISSVIYNRLEHREVTNGLLQIDATLAYINGGQVPTEADKAIDSPYNTYLYTGLPAGPIANPGSEAIWAAMHPASTGYYYYALGTDGLHHFSKTYSEHQSFLNSLPKD